MYQLYTDGSSFFRLKRSGWAYMLKMTACIVTDSGCEAGANINKFELLAVINGLEAIPGAEAEVTVYTDSEFVMGCANMKHVRARWMTPFVLAFRKQLNRHKVYFVKLPKRHKPLEHHEVHMLAQKAAQDGYIANTNGQQIRPA